MPGIPTLEALLRRDRAVVLIGLGAVILASWAYILAGAGMGMSAFEMAGTGGAPDAGQASGDGGTMAEGMAAAAVTPAAWSTGYAALMLLMWWVMMVAMMLPSAAPMILLFARVNERQKARGAPYVPTGVFALGYVLVWGAFSVAAVGVQWGLEASGLLSGMLASTSAVLGGGLLIAAGLYQLTPLKHACLRHCSSPLQFISHRWRPGAAGALRMGVEHGAFCTGCCWVLMGLLFYGGVMNLYWIAGLALYVLLEKTLPGRHWLGRGVGALLIGWGGALLITAA